MKISNISKITDLKFCYHLKGIDLDYVVPQSFINDIDEVSTLKPLNGILHIYIKNTFTDSRLVKYIELMEKIKNEKCYLYSSNI